MRKSYVVAAVIGVLMYGHCAWAENVRGITSTSPTIQRTQAVISSVQTKIIPKLVAKGKQLFLELNQNAKKVDVLSGGRKVAPEGPMS